MNKSDAWNCIYRAKSMALELSDLLDRLPDDGGMIRLSYESVTRAVVTMQRAVIALTDEFAELIEAVDIDAVAELDEALEKAMTLTAEVNRQRRAIERLETEATRQRANATEWQETFWQCRAYAQQAGADMAQFDESVGKWNEGRDARLSEYRGHGGTVINIDRGFERPDNNTAVDAF